MKILVACEESQVVTKAFRDKGHKAFSCDILPTSGDSPEWHYQEDVSKVLMAQQWDMIIAFPPCQYLTGVGNRHFSRRINPEKKVLAREAKRLLAFEFFMNLVNYDCEKICIENPVGFVNTNYRKPDQIIHPYYFGDPFKKRTCLWLKNLSKLKHTNVLPEPKPVRISEGKISKGKKINWVESITGSKKRSKTFQGIADAMAGQWG